MNKTTKEHIEQVTFVSWMRREHPEIRFFAIPNGELRAPSVAKRLQAEGVEPGVPDLFIPALKLFIEMKRTKNSNTSKEQKEWKEYLESCGYRSEIAKGHEKAIECVKNALQSKVV